VQGTAQHISREAIGGRPKPASISGTKKGHTAKQAEGVALTFCQRTSPALASRGFLFIFFRKFSGDFERAIFTFGRAALSLLLCAGVVRRVRSLEISNDLGWASGVVRATRPEQLTLGGNEDMKSSIHSLSDSAKHQSSISARMGGSLADSWTRAASTSMQIASALGNEAFRFASRRLDRNRGMAEQLTKCASWQDLLDLQMTWANQLIQDYTDGSREFIGTIRDVASQVGSVAEQEIEEAGDEVKKAAHSSGRRSARAESSPA
jgi:Phasin protein